MYLCVRLYVREHISGSAGPICTKFFVQIPVAVARSSSGGVTIRYVLPVLLMTSGLAILGRMAMHGRLNLEPTIPLERRCDTGAESDVYECLVSNALLSALKVNGHPYVTRLEKHILLCRCAGSMNYSSRQPGPRNGLLLNLQVDQNNYLYSMSSSAGFRVCSLCKFSLHFQKNIPTYGFRTVFSGSFPIVNPGYNTVFLLRSQITSSTEYTRAKYVGRETAKHCSESERSV